MNKDVIYIEPEQDITDILANIKASKHKIVALVPPKKASVLRSAVNFKLIAKTAKQNDKTVVLITADQSLRRLAASVKMPVAKTLQSKPQLPEDLEEESEEADNDVIEGKKDKEEENAEEPAKPPKVPKMGKKVPVATAVAVKHGEAKADAEEDDVIEGEPEAKDDKEPKSKSEKKVAKMKGSKIPNFAKYRKFIIAGAIALVLIGGFLFWAFAIAPHVTIDVTVKASKVNFAEKVTFVDDAAKSDPKTGVLFLEQKSVTKKVEADFEATGKLDKGAKASGAITVTLPAGSSIKGRKSLSIPKDTVFKINGKEYVVTEGKSVQIAEPTADNFGTYWNFCTKTDVNSQCSKADISSGAIPVVSKEVGEGYNIAAATSGITASVSLDGYKVSSSAMAGGSSKIVTIVSPEDFEKAKSDLPNTAENEARDELTAQFGDNFILLGSMGQSEPKIVTSPNINEEVGDGVTPHIVKEITYTLYAVERDSANTYIETVLKATLNEGDNTQTIYDTGIKGAFFDQFVNTNEEKSAKLKAEAKAGPDVTQERIKNESLGNKTGEVKTRLNSIKGVSSVKVTPNFFWVSRVPSDINRVDINIKLEIAN